MFSRQTKTWRDIIADNNTAKSSGKYSHFSIEEREEISLMLAANFKVVDIARKLNRHPASVYREIKRNRPKHRDVRYRANRAQLLADERKRETHRKQRLKNDVIRTYVESKLKEFWSPLVIAGRLPMDLPGYSINYESIYQWIYTDRRDLIAMLPQAHKKRRKRCSAKNKRSVKVPNRTMISERPQKIAMREEAGHWEADTAVSRESKAAIVALTERKSRFFIARKVAGKTAENMNQVLVETLSGISKSLVKSITYDNGTENTLHETTSRILEIPAYFCNPYHSWEKGSIENRIGKLRYFFPKKTDWKKVTDEMIDRAVFLINNRPLKCLGFKTPQEVFVALGY